MTPVTLGPWHQGIDIFHDPTHAVFQQGRESSPRLVKAVNVDLDDDGYPQVRDGSVLRTTLTAGKNGFSFADMLVVQDGGNILLIDPMDWQNPTTLVSGLSPSARVEFHGFDDQIFWTNGIVQGRIKDSVATNWGMVVPASPGLAPVAGGLPAGRYQVAVTWLDGNGIESGADQASAIELDGTEDIQVSVTQNDPNVVSAQIYATGPDVKAEGGLFWVNSFPIGSFPVTISEVKESRYTLKTQYMRGPPIGQGIFSYKETIGTWAGKWIYPDSGISNHVFLVGHNAFRVPHFIHSVRGTSGGLFVSTESGMYFLHGDSPRTVVRTKKDNLDYAVGSWGIPGAWIPSLETNEMVALFVNSEGLVAAIPGGQLVPLTQDRLPLDVFGKRANIFVRRKNDFRQIGFTLEDI